MTNFFVVYNQALTSGGEGRSGNKHDRNPTPKLLEGPVSAKVVKVEASSVAEAQAFVRQLLGSGSSSTIIAVTEAQWKET